MVARCGVVVAFVASCSGEPLERLPAPAKVIELAPLPPPPPPPPPPPETPLSLDPPRNEPPVELSDVLSPTSDPPFVTLVELTEGRGEPAFLGYGILRTKPLTAAHAQALVEKLAGDKAFIDGGNYDCFGEPIGIHFLRGSTICDVVVDCGRMYLTPSRHDGRFALLAPDVNQFIYALR